MFWKKKNFKGLPDLPVIESSEIPLPPKEEIMSSSATTEKFKEKEKIPLIPQSPENQNEEAIKKAVLDSSTNNEIEKEIINIPQSKKVFKTIELEEWTPQSSTSIKTPTQTNPIQTIQFEETKPMEKIAAPSPISPQIKAETQKEAHSEIYIKIDKFFSAKRALSAAKEKLEEIDELLKKIRETKLREEQELEAWEKDLLSLKTRIKEVTNTLSEKA